MMAVTTSAQVGINTTEPTQTLDVNGTARIRSLAEIPYDRDAGDRFLYIKDDGTLAKLSFFCRNN